MYQMKKFKRVLNSQINGCFSKQYSYNFLLHSNVVFCNENDLLHECLGALSIIPKKYINHRELEDLHKLCIKDYTSVQSTIEKRKIRTETVFNAEKENAINILVLNRILSLNKLNIFPEDPFDKRQWRNSLFQKNTTQLNEYNTQKSITQ